MLYRMQSLEEESCHQTELFNDRRNYLTAQDLEGNPPHSTLQFQHSLECNSERNVCNYVSCREKSQ